LKVLSGSVAQKQHPTPNPLSRRSSRRWQ